MLSRTHFGVEPIYFYKKMRKKIIKPTIIWSILYVLFVELKNYIA